MRKADPHARELLLISVERVEMVGVSALSEHPNQMKSPRLVLQKNELLSIVRMELNGEVVLAGELKERLVFFVEDRTP